MSEKFVFLCKEQTEEREFGQKNKKTKEKYILLFLCLTTPISPAKKLKICVNLYNP